MVLDFGTKLQYHPYPCRILAIHFLLMSGLFLRSDLYLWKMLDFQLDFSRVRSSIGKSMDFMFQTWIPCIGVWKMLEIQLDFLMIGSSIGKSMDFFFRKLSTIHRGGVRIKNGMAHSPSLTETFQLVSILLVGGYVK